MRPNHIITAMIICLALSSCIKEDRTKCPCYLHLDLSRVDSNYIHTLNLMMDSGSTFPEWIPVERTLLGDTLIIPVGKSEFDFCAWGNLSSSLLDGENRVISPGMQQDSLWSDYRRINTRCEDAYISVIPTRQFIPVTIIVRGMLGGITRIDAELGHISSRLSFTGAATGAAGAIHPRLDKTPASNGGYYLYRTMILTQTSATAATLSIEFDRDGHTFHSSFPLGEMLLSSGEDISLTSQKPIILDLTVGTANILLTIKVEDWTAHGVFEITL